MARQAQPLRITMGRMPASKGNRHGNRKTDWLGLHPLKQAELELVAIEMAEFELASRVGIRLPNPLSSLEAVDRGLAAGFYWGLNHQTAIPVTSRDLVERNLDAYAAGVLARELIDLGGQE